MIQSFKVKNCLSIRGEQVLDFVATNDDTSEDIMVVRKNNVRLLKVGLIYGANASGKSNILLALGWLVRFIGGLSDQNNTNVMYAPFLLDDESSKMPTEMELVFYIDDVKYEYSLAIQNNVVQYESLSRYPLGRPVVVFKRVWNDDTKSSDILFGSSLKLNSKQKYTITGLTLPHSSVVSTYIRNNIDRIDVFDDVKDFFRRRMMPMLLGNSEIEKFTNRMMKIAPQLKNFIIKVLGQADFNISDFILKEKKSEIPEELWQELQNLSDYFDETPPRTFTEEQLFFEHTSLGYKELLPIDAESIGTSRMYGLATYLFFLAHTNSIMLADEIESSLHYDLLRYFVSLFLLNSDDSQLICTTHSLLLLDEPFIRRDCIHICRKDGMGATEVIRASEFGLRKGVSILRAYREGKLGGIPKLGGLIIKS